MTEDTSTPDDRPQLGGAILLVLAVLWLAATMWSTRASIAGGTADPAVVISSAALALPTVVAAGSDHSVRVSAEGRRDWVQMVRRPMGDVSLSYAGEVEVVADAAVAPVVAEPVARRAPLVRTGVRVRTPVANGRAGGPPNSLVGGGY